MSLLWFSRFAPQQRTTTMRVARDVRAIRAHLEHLDQQTQTGGHAIVDINPDRIDESVGRIFRFGTGPRNQRTRAAARRSAARLSADQEQAALIHQLLLKIDPAYAAEVAHAEAVTWDPPDLKVLPPPTPETQA